MSKKLYIIRHGQTLFNLLDKVQGASDSPLTELGIKQAETARNYIENMELYMIMRILQHKSVL